MENGGNAGAGAESANIAMNDRGEARQAAGKKPDSGDTAMNGTSNARPAPSNATQRGTALIVGAGIGGLCAALALRQIGWSAVLFDRLPQIEAVGAGIVLGANAVKALRKLGVAERVLRYGMPVGKAEIRDAGGRLLTNLPAARQAELYGTSGYLIRRSDLQRALLEELKPDISVQLGKKLVSWEQTPASVTARFEDGSFAAGDALIAADGLHSAARARLAGSDPLRYAGYTAFRGISRFEDSRYPYELGGGFEAWGRGCRFGYSVVGSGEVYWFAAVNAPQGSGLVAPEDRKSALLRQFRGWYRPVEAVIEAAEPAAILNHDIFDRKPLTAWSEGRVALLGDAAHPMLPNLGQGGAQAMEDALALAHCLRGRGAEEVAFALSAYGRLRIPRTSRVVRQSRRMGRIVQMERRLAVAVRNALVRAMPARLQIAQFRWLLEYDCNFEDA